MIGTRSDESPVHWRARLRACMCSSLAILATGRDEESAR